MLRRISYFLEGERKVVGDGGWSLHTARDKQTLCRPVLSFFEGLFIFRHRKIFASLKKEREKATGFLPGRRRWRQQQQHKLIK